MSNIVTSSNQTSTHSNSDQAGNSIRVGCSSFLNGLSTLVCIRRRSEIRCSPADSFVQQLLYVGDSHTDSVIENRNRLTQQLSEHPHLQAALSQERLTPSQKMAYLLRQLNENNALHLTGLNLSGADLRGANLYRANLSEANLSRANLTGADLRGVNLSRAILTEVNLDGAILSSADLRGANLGWAKLIGADLRGANLSGATLIGAILSSADLSGANLGGADLTGADLSKANLDGAILSSADLSGANLREAKLIGADLTGADLSGANLVLADLSGANLSGATLIGAILSSANLSGVNLSGFDLTGANLRGANLSVANLDGAKLTGANLDMADLRGANLEGAKLTGAILWWANLSGADLSRAFLDGANLNGVIWGTVLPETVLAVMAMAPDDPNHLNWARECLSACRDIELDTNRELTPESETKVPQALDAIDTIPHINKKNTLINLFQSLITLKNTPPSDHQSIKAAALLCALSERFTSLAHTLSATDPSLSPEKRSDLIVRLLTEFQRNPLPQPTQ